MDGIIFDFNGTLYWDSQLHYDAWKEFSKILRGYEFTDEEMREKMFGHANEDIIAYAIGKKPSKEMAEKYSKEKEALYRKCCLECPDKFNLAPGAIELLDYLKEKNVPRTIATMSDWDNVEFYIKELDIGKWFDVDKIVYSDGSFQGKPAPDIFKLASEKLGIEPSKCVVVEDTIAGFQSAKKAGIGKVIAIASLEPIEFYEKIKEVDCVISDFYEFDKSLFGVK